MEDSKTYGFVSASSLNVRKGPGTDQAKVTSLSAGAQVEVGSVHEALIQLKEAIDSYLDSAGKAEKKNA